MKKFILPLIACGLFATTADAQTARFGVKGAVNLASSAVENQKGSNKSDAQLGVGATAGGFMELSFKNPGDKLKGQVEVLYNFYNFKGEFDLTNNELKSQFHSIQVPLEAKYFITPSFSVYAGPTFNFNLAGSRAFDGKDKVAIDADDINVFQIGGIVGLNYYVKNGFFVEAKYNYVGGSMLKDNNTYNQDYKGINAVQIGVGYKFKRN